jgi:hypothetical protein
MALNTPDAYDWQLDDIISVNINELCQELHKIGFENIEADDISYEFLTRCEHLGISSEKIYPGEDLPGKFGVYRGYNGGGIHGGLCESEYNRLPKNRLAKAGRAIEIFRKYFWKKNLG